MLFETGRCYKHTTGLSMHIIANLDTTLWGFTMIAEQSNGKLIPVNRQSTDNWKQISREEWLSNFN
jgi:hypothetical protein